MTNNDRINYLVFAKNRAPLLHRGNKLSASEVTQNLYPVHLPSLHEIRQGIDAHLTKHGCSQDQYGLHWSTTRSSEGR